MFIIDDDMSIHATRGDTVFFTVTAEDNGENYVFQDGDVLRIKVTDKKGCDNVVLQKDFLITGATESVDIILSGQDTKFGDVISKPKEYWYEVELNPFTNPQTIIGYDDEGAKIFKLYPEGKDLVEELPEDVDIVDAMLDPTSTRPIQNQAVTLAIMNLSKVLMNIDEHVADIVSDVVSNNPITVNMNYDANTEALILQASEVGGKE